MYLTLNVWFQKISIPPPRRELEIPEGWGVKVPGNSRGDGGKRRNFRPEGRKSIDFLRMSIGASYLL